MNILYQMFLNFRTGILAIPWRVISLSFIIILMLIPLFSQQPYLLRVISFCAIFSLFAASWDFLAGFTGQFSLGHALFFGCSAYATAILSTRFGISSPWITIPIGALVAVFAGVVACLPALRLRGFFLGLVTLALPLIFGGIIEAFPDYTGGEIGIYGISRLSGSRITDYYIILVMMIVSLFILWKLTDLRSKKIRTGIIFRGIREDEIAARVSGINTVFYKFIAFAISGFFAGISGGLYAHYLRIVGPSTTNLLFSFYPFIWCIFGGIGSLYGAVTGVFILYGVTEVLSLFKIAAELKFIFQAIVLILVILWMPEGVTRWFRDRIEIDCPRCKLINSVFRKSCRACRAELHQEKKFQLGRE
jgi:branched-chain amino acid transport system permease protein